MTESGKRPRRAPAPVGAGRETQFGSDLPDLSGFDLSVAPSASKGHKAGQNWRTTSCLCACHYGSIACENKQPCDKVPYVQRRRP